MKRNLKQVKTDFVKIARMTQAELKEYLISALVHMGYAPIREDGFIYARGAHVLLTAHMDTVHAVPVKKVITDTYPGDIVIASPQGIGGDDRCGVWIILDTLQRLIKIGVRPAVLFCEDEEIGGVGSEKFCRTDYIAELSDLKYLIELDRKGYNDAVFYDDDNRQFKDYITRTTGYQFAYGSFSDISHLCPACGRSGVNLSCGYYNPHQLNEYVITSEMTHTADITVKLIKDTVKNNVQQFDYIDAYDGFGLYEDSSYMSGIEFQYLDEGRQASAFYEAYTLYDAIGQFLYDHPGMCWNDVLDYEMF